MATLHPQIQELEPYELNNTRVDSATWMHVLTFNITGYVCVVSLHFKYTNLGNKMNKLGRAGWENIRLSVMAQGPRCARSVRQDLEPNIFPSGPPN